MKKIFIGLVAAVSVSMLVGNTGNAWADSTASSSGKEQKERRNVIVQTYDGMETFSVIDDPNLINNVLKEIEDELVIGAVTTKIFCVTIEYRGKLRTFTPGRCK